MRNTNWIKTYLIDILPGVSILLYILAIVYQMAFFSAFDISVLSYISLTETLISIIEPLLIFTLFFLLSAFILFRFSTPSPSLFPGKKQVIAFLDKNKHHPVIVKLLIAIPLFPALIAYTIIYSIVMPPEKIIKMLVDEKNRYMRWFTYGGTAVIYFALSYLAWRLTEPNYNGMAKALYGLVMPLMILDFIVTIRSFFPNPEEMVETLKKISVRGRAFVLIVYYIFSIIVFSHSGFAYGNMLKNNDSTLFTIKMEDGSSFDNSGYVYISKMGDHVFLYERQSGANIILNNENITCQRIINDDLRKSLLSPYKKKTTIIDIGEATRTTNEVTGGRFD